MLSEIRRVLREKYHGELPDGLKSEDLHRARFPTDDELPEQIKQEYDIHDPRYVFFVVERHPGAHVGSINRVDVFYVWDRASDTLAPVYEKQLGFSGFSVDTWLINLTYSIVEDIEGLEVSVLPDGRLRLEEEGIIATSVEELARAYASSWDFSCDAELVADDAQLAGYHITAAEIEDEMRAAFVTHVEEILRQKLSKLKRLAD